MKILEIPLKKNRKELEEVACYIKKGKVFIFPTDTVYGLICDVTSKKAVNKVFKMKKRSLKKAIPIFVKDLREAKKIAEINKFQERILKKVWPGKTTAVLKRKSDKKIYGIERKTIALRVPKYKILNKILELTNLPLAATSANVSGSPSSTEIEKVKNQFKKREIKPDFIISAGNLKKSKPSKIIDITNRRIKILRK